MKNNKGITLVMAVMTVLLLAIIAGVSITVGVNTYRNAQIVEFETTMSIIQKKVDIIVEETEDFSNYGIDGKARHYTMISNIMSGNYKNSSYIRTTLEEVAYAIQNKNTQIRFFTAANMKTVFGVDTDSTFLINFAKREVINMSGVEIGGETFFVLNGLHESLEGND